MITIPKNTYVPPTEVREEVVKAICEAFLWSITHRGCESGCVYHPLGDRGYRDTHRYVKLKDGEGFEFTCDPFLDRTKHPEDFLTFNREEMKQAFEELRKAGYHMLQVFEYGTWRGYICGIKPYSTWNCFDREVFGFTDLID